MKRTLLTVLAIGGVFVAGTALICFGLSFALVPFMGIWAGAIVWPLSFAWGASVIVWMPAMADRMLR